MFLIAYDWLSAPEMSRNIISRHAGDIIHHIIQTDPAGLQRGAQKPEVSPPLAESVLLNHFLREPLEIVNAVFFSSESEHILAFLYQQSCRSSQENPSFRSQIASIAFTFFSFLSKFLFLNQGLLAFRRIFLFNTQQSKG